MRVAAQTHYFSISRATDRAAAAATGVETRALGKDAGDGGARMSEDYSAVLRRWGAVQPGSEWRWQTNEMTARANVAALCRRTKGTISKATDVATESCR